MKCKDSFSRSLQGGGAKSGKRSNYNSVIISLNMNKNNECYQQTTAPLKVFIYIYTASACAFLVLLAMDMVGIGRTALKSIPVSTLIVLMLRDMRGYARICLIGALLCSVCGDILLDLPYAHFFIFGLVAFLVGHVFYAVLFFRFAKSPDRFGITMMAALVIFAVMMVWIFRGIARPIRSRGALYCGDYHNEYRRTPGSRREPPAFLGRPPFIASDVVLA